MLYSRHFLVNYFIYSNEFESESHSVVSDALRPHGLYSPWNSPGQNTGVGSWSLLQGIFPTQGLNPGLPHCRWIPAEPPGKPSSDFTCILIEENEYFVSYYLRARNDMGTALF